MIELETMKARLYAVEHDVAVFLNSLEDDTGCRVVAIELVHGYEQHDEMPYSIIARVHIHLEV